MNLIIKIIIIFICLVLPEKTQAYLDPGTGSYIFQLIIGALLGGLFMIKIFFRNIKLFFINLFAKTKKDKNNGKNNEQ